MEKKIALYLDGTWNTPEDRTNVFALFEETVGDMAGPDILKPFIPGWKKPLAAIKNFFASEGHHRWLREKYIALRDSPQVRYYDQGVGTHFMNLFRGGAFGKGVNINIQQAYEFLCYCYQPGDEIYVFGFSRGAYTARSLVGVISILGLLKENECLDQKKRKQAMAYVKNIIDSVNRQRLIREAKQQNKKPPKPLPEPEKPDWLKNKQRPMPVIKMLGVWDTVGAMGVPQRFQKLLPFIQQYQAFPNTQLCSNVEHAYHAMAIDEHRKDFLHTPWTYSSESTELPAVMKEVQQQWFVGAHANIGGGYKDNYLNEISCHWLQKKAKDLGLVFHRELKASDRAIKEPIKDSYEEFAGGIHKIFNDRVSRVITAGQGEKMDGIVKESIHESVWQYARQNIYRPKNIPAREIDKYLNGEKWHGVIQ